MSLKDWYRYGKAVGSGEVRLRAGQVDTVLTVAILGMTILLGILIYSEVYDTTFGTIGTDYTNQSSTDNAARNATTDYGDAMELAPVIMIVLIAAVVLGVVQRFR